MKQACHAFWRGKDIAVTVSGVLVDQVPADAIRRVVIVETGIPQSASDHAFALLETDDSYLIFPPDSGFAGLVHFERQSFWASHPCVYWSRASDVALPDGCAFSRGLLRRSAPRFQRLAKSACPGLLDAWPQEGPQCWDERRRQHIERQRGFAAESGRAAAAILYLARQRA